MKTKNYTIEDLIYLAGFFDGEGSIGISKASRPWGYYYQARFKIGNTYLDTLKWAKIKFGGDITIEKIAGTIDKTGTKHNKDMFRWQLRIPEIKNLLPDLIPYLKEKKERALLVLEYINKQRDYGRGGRPDWYVKWQEEMYQKSKKLNNQTVDQTVDVNSINEETENNEYEQLGIFDFGDE